MAIGLGRHESPVVEMYPLQVRTGPVLSMLSRLDCPQVFREATNTSILTTNGEFSLAPLIDTMTLPLSPKGLPSDPAFTSSFSVPLDLETVLS